MAWLVAKWVKTGARKIAVAFYDALTIGTDYVEQGVVKYEELHKKREIKLLNKLAQKHNYKVASLEECYKFSS